VIHSRTYGPQFCSANVSRFALSEKIDAVLTRQSHILEVEKDAANLPLRGD
jgi:hypothetical protein